MNKFLTLENYSKYPLAALGYADRCDQVIVVKDNKMSYIILSYNNWVMTTKHLEYTLHEAMKRILSTAPDNTMHVKELADRIYEQRLYLMKNGKRASYIQVRSRASRYHQMFDMLQDNMVKLRTEETD